MTTKRLSRALLNDDEADRAVILFGLVFARRFLRHARWTPAVKASVHARVMQLIEEYKNPEEE